MATSVFCLTKNTLQAERIVERLRSTGFSDNDISVLFPDEAGTKTFAHEHHTKAPEGAATGAVSGGVVGGTLGLLAGIGALAIPGLGAFIAAGPIMATLGGAAAGGAIGTLAGALIGMGIPEFEAKRYEERLRQGNVLIAVHCEDGDEVSHAKEILNDLGAEDVSSAHEESVPKADRD